MQHTFNTLTRVQKLPCNHTNKVTSEVQCTVSAYRVYRLLFICQFCLHIVFFVLLHCVIIVVFCCFPLLAVGDIMSASAYFWAVFFFFSQCEALFLHLYLRRCPHFVEVVSSCCIKALSLSFFILRLRPHILF